MKTCAFLINSKESRGLVFLIEIFPEIQEGPLFSCMSQGSLHRARAAVYSCHVPNGEVSRPVRDSKWPVHFIIFKFLLYFILFWVGSPMWFRLRLNPLCSPGWPQTHRYLPASASQECATMPNFVLLLTVLNLYFSSPVVQIGSMSWNYILTETFSVYFALL